MSAINSPFRYAGGKFYARKLIAEHLIDTEVYCEPFDIPEPDELVFIGNYEGGEAFRSGCCWRRGNGNIFYFQPGHESFPVFKQAEIITILKNAIKWANPIYRLETLDCPHIEAKDRVNSPV